MILAAGLTPAWQHILLFDNFSVDAVNRAREYHWVASGKVLNVGIALHHLGGGSKTVALVGGSAGASIEAEFLEMGIPASWVRSSVRTRVCTTVLDEGVGLEREASDGRLQMTEIVENADPMAEGDYESFLRAFAEELRSADIVVLAGSLPRETPTRFYRDLLEECKVPVVLDARGPELREALDKEPFVVKPNREELSVTVDRPVTRDDELRDALRELHSRGAQWAVVSHGKRSVWITSADGDHFIAEPPRVDDAANPIACGDCLAAGIAWGIREGKSVPEAVKIGIGSAVQNLRDVLPSRLDIDTVLGIAQQVRLTRA